MNITFLGLGKMGLAMARRLLDAGHTLTVWNRTPDRAQPLIAAGAILAQSAAQAATNADAVHTMLFDDDANEEVLFGVNGSNGVLEALRPNALHIAHSTISVPLSQRLADEHARRRQGYVAAPVFGRPNVAEEGRLWIVAAGAATAIEQARPLLEKLSRGLTVLGPEAAQAHALKLGGNFLISAMIHSLAESFTYSSAQGIDPAQFLETVNAALFQSPFYAAYGNVMLNPPQEPGATIDLGAKDLALLRQAATLKDARVSLADNMAEIFAEAQRTGLADEDWAVGQYKMAQRRSKITSNK